MPTTQHGDRIFNPETMRAAMPVLFGFACYTCAERAPRTGSTYHLDLDHAGIVGDGPTALKWVEGDDSVQIYRLNPEYKARQREAEQQLERELGSI